MSIEEYRRFFMRNIGFVDTALSDSAKEYYRIVDRMTLNYRVIYELGKDEYIKQVNIPDSMINDFNYVQDHIFYSSTYNSSFTALELFLWRFLLEKLNNNTIKTRNDLQNYLKNKYNYKYISFQKLDFTNDYYKNEIGVDLKRFERYDDLSQRFMQLRHDCTHNFGIIGENSFIPITKDAVIMMLSMQIAFVNYIDSYLISRSSS